MSEIPDDVMKAANDAVNSAIDDRGAIGVIARAILAERERCARLCEDTAMVVTSGRTKPDFGIYSGEPADMTAGNTHPGVGYAAAIRKGATT